MRSRELQQFLASITGRPLSEIDQRCRPLREELKIATGPRGQSAPHMTIGEGLFHILSLVSRRPADAFQVAEHLFSNCCLIRSPDQPGLSEAFRGEGRKLANFMLVAMNRGYEAAGFKIKSFELQEDGSAAWMTFDRRSLHNVRFFFSSSEHLQKLPNEEAERIFHSVDSNSAGNRFFIGVDHLKSLGKRILIDNPGSGGSPDCADHLNDDELVVATTNDGTA
ncbi:hypothetical protein [Mesorhizobium sp. M2A.F.Ca.ET.067.02.1.1]|uniref:hypothetical protein n=1 Tax=Mesorhizobium sp. M2A.F.Ca.ET.067.02.1.1 TaxID=2496749 RepID=UPI000FD264CA|nr:hypothetical protein [Mesorhizobium sp. M2A.F.Ca.ET.067.02.1.1]RUW81498.1 hypothetical protein EOA28_00795 [Mesorhizobium sp. M2A.F.Ca.ET.067.02.1.1]TIU58000.1 MAG: hypothetical protein E5W35_06490 [Mesorhizobium sp.]